VGGSDANGSGTDQSGQFPVSMAHHRKTKSQVTVILAI